MEFNFKINELFKKPLVKITNTLLPPGLTVDHPNIRDYQTKVIKVINAMGLASSAEQGLAKPITSSDKLRDSYDTAYLLIDLQGGSDGNGCVIGLLKVGRKGLKLFDLVDHHHQLKPLCVFDFFIHESHRRIGLGHQLFEHMLKEEDVEISGIAIYRPNKQLLSFLSKHYKLNHIIPQMSNFVVFEEFFDLIQDKDEENGQSYKRTKLMDNDPNENSSNFQKCKNTGARRIRRYKPHVYRNKLEEIFAVFHDYSAETSCSYPVPTNKDLVSLGRHGAHYPSDHVTDQVNPVIGDPSTDNFPNKSEPIDIVAADLDLRGAYHPPDHVFSAYYSTKNSNFQDSTNRI